MSARDRLQQAWPDHRGLVLGALAASLTLGLAPFYPHPHVWKQLVSLAHGTLREPIDIFDLFLHGTPWLVLLIALARLARAAHATS